jgi:hypothetical protein
LEEVGRILKPGGIFVSGEWGRRAVLDPSCSSDIAINTPGIDRFGDAITAALAAKGIGQVVQSIPSWLSRATSAEFTEIIPNVFYVPIGSWHADPRLQTIGRAYRSSLKKFAQAMEPMLREAGWSDDELDELIRGMVHDTKNVAGISGVYHTVYARKI